MVIWHFISSLRMPSAKPSFARSNMTREPHPLDPDPEDSDALATERRSPHPLDDEGQIEDVSLAQESSTQVFRPLLKPCIVGISAGFVVAFLAGVTAANASPQSTGEVVGSALQRVGIIVMLVSFCGILLAYRIPHMKKIPLKSPKQLRIPEFLSLLVSHTVFLVLFWIVLLIAQSLLGPFAIGVIAYVLTLYASLLTVAAVWRTGCRRAYAIGALATIILSFYGGAGSLFVGGYYTRASANMAWPIGVFLSIVVLNGLICAGYATFIINSTAHTSPTTTAPPSNSDEHDRNDQAGTTFID